MAKRLLTRRKQAWVARRKPEVVRGLPINPNAAIEARYYARLERDINRMCDRVQVSLERLFSKEVAVEYFAQDESIASKARILTNELTRRFMDIFNAQAMSIAEAMARESDAASSASVHSSIQQLSGGLSLPTTAITKPMKEILKATVTENVGLIKSIPTQYLQGVQGAVMRSITNGGGLKTLVPYLEKHRGVTLRRARMIAKDQTRKAMNNLSAARLENLGLKKFEWLHTGGSAEPRQLHIDYSGRIFSFDDPPVIDKNTGERGLPGQAINCRCRIVPVIEFGDE